MKGLSVIIAAFFLLFGAATSRAENLDRMSAATGIPIDTLQAERASTGLGWGSLEKAHLLANATGQNFNDLVAQHQAGQGWGKIAHDNGLNLGRLVSDAHRSSQATTHAQNTQAVHGKNAMTARGKTSTVHGKNGTTVRGRSAKNIGRTHRSGMSTARSPRSSFRSGFSGSYGMRSMGHLSGSRGMGSMGHGGGHGR